MKIWLLTSVWIWRMSSIAVSNGRPIIANSSSIVQRKMYLLCYLVYFPTDWQSGSPSQKPLWFQRSLYTHFFGSYERLRSPNLHGQFSPDFWGGLVAPSVPAESACETSLRVHSRNGGVHPTQIRVSRSFVKSSLLKNCARLPASDLQ